MRLTSTHNTNTTAITATIQNTLQQYSSAEKMSIQIKLAQFVKSLVVKTNTQHNTTMKNATSSEF